MYRRELYLCKLRYVKDILNRARDLNRTRTKRKIKVFLTPSLVCYMDPEMQ